MNNFSILKMHNVFHENAYETACFTGKLFPILLVLNMKS